METVCVDIWSHHLLPLLGRLDMLCVAATCRALRVVVDISVRRYMHTLKPGNYAGGNDVIYQIQYNTPYALLQWMPNDAQVDIDFWVITRSDEKRLRMLDTSCLHRRMRMRSNEWHHWLARCIIDSLACMESEEDARSWLSKMNAHAILPHVHTDFMPSISEDPETDRKFMDNALGKQMSLETRHTLILFAHISRRKVPTPAQFGALVEAFVKQYNDGKAMHTPAPDA